MKTYISVFFLAAAASGMSIDQLTNKLQPVQSLYVKPSADGITGDLYVAATEENGLSRWLTDTPVNFLNPATLAKTSNILPSGFPAGILSQLESANQKRAVVNSGTPTIASSSEAKKDLAKSILNVEPVKNIQGAEISAAALTQSPFQFSPYQFFYPNLMTAALTDQKDNQEEGKTNAALAQAQQIQAAYWPNSAYSYATYPYMMMDPRFWAWAQNAAIASNQTPAVEGTSADENNNE